jgi:GxxExxY protein
MEINVLTQKVIGCAIEVHKELGPGLLESTYEHCLRYELCTQGLNVQSQLMLPVHYKSTTIDAGYRLDLLVDNNLIVELKAVDKLSNIYLAQMMTYLKLTGIKTGLIINFNVTKLIDGIKRVSL